MRFAMRTLTLFCGAAVFFCITLPIHAQGNDPITAIQQKLQQSITLATLDANGDIATAGSVVTLQKGPLQLCATSSPANAGAPANNYKNGKLSAGMFSWNLGLGLMSIDPNTIPMHTYSAGDKLWVVRINVKKNGVELKLWSDPDTNNFRYWGWLEIPFPKNQIPSPDDVMKTLAEVLTVDNQSVQQAADASAVPAQNGGLAIQGKYVRKDKISDFFELGPGGEFSLFYNGMAYAGTYKIEGDTLIMTGPHIKGQFHINGDTLTDQDGPVYEKQVENAAVPPAPPARQYDNLAPPPPPPAPAPTITIGERKAQVLTDFGEPQRKAATGPKEIYFYTDLKMKVTFINGKVSSIE